MKRYIKTAKETWSVPARISDWGDYKGVPACYIEQYIIRIYDEETSYKWTIVDLDIIDVIAEGVCDTQEDCFDEINNALTMISSGELDKYAEGPDDIREWYIESFPTDSLGKDIKKGLTPRKVWKRIKNGEDIDEILGVGDSILRNHVINRMSYVLGLSYDTIYNAL